MPRFCVHGKLAAYCKKPECIAKATAICRHGRRKNRCKEPECIAKATALCPHGRQKAYCKDPECISRATGICPHGRQKTQCKEPECIVKATAICPHGRRKTHCKEPVCIGKATAICPHGRRKAYCKEPECVAKATAICSHGRHKTQCKDPECIAKATAICPHGRLKAACPDCAPLQNRLQRGTVCAGCGMVGRKGRYKYTLCKSCSEPETTEKQVFDFLGHFFPGIQYSKSSYMGGKFCPQVGAGCTGAYPDMYIALEDRVVFIEVDEHPPSKGFRTLQSGGQNQNWPINGHIGDINLVVKGIPNAS